MRWANRASCPQPMTGGSAIFRHYQLRNFCAGRSRSKPFEDLNAQRAVRFGRPLSWSPLHCQRRLETRMTVRTLVFRHFL